MNYPLIFQRTSPFHRFQQNTVKKRFPIHSSIITFHRSQTKIFQEPMRRSLIHQILIYIYRNDAINQKQINVTAFLKVLRDENADRANNFNRITMALQRIEKTGYASYSCSPENHQLNQTVGNVICTLDNTEVYMSINLEGWTFTKNFISQNEQNASTLATNESVKNLNKLLPEYYQRQLRLTRVTIWVAAVSLMAVLFPAYFSSKFITGAQFDRTNALLQRDMQILDSIRLHERAIDNTLQKAVKDSLYRPRSIH
jgi:hypothetical protein